MPIVVEAFPQPVGVDPMTAVRRAVVLLFVAALVSIASCKAHPPAAEIALFNGKDLTGWQVTECDVEVKDGVLLLKQGEGWVRTDHQYGDFVLSWECKNLKPDM